MQFKNYDAKIFPAWLGWLKHFPASAQLKFDSASAQTFFSWTFAASALVPRSTQYDVLTYKMAITLRPQICDVTSLYVWIWYEKITSLSPYVFPHHRKQIQLSCLWHSMKTKFTGNRPIFAPSCFMLCQVPQKKLRDCSHRIFNRLDAYSGAQPKISHL